MKAHIKRWVNEKHDVLTASDMKNALESHGGVKGCRAAIVQMDVSAENNSSTNKIPGISLLKNGLRVWCAYNTGLGKVITYHDLNVSPQQDTNLQAQSATQSQREQRYFPAGKVLVCLHSRQ